MPLPQGPFIPWRIDDLPGDKIMHADITEKSDLERLFASISFALLFDLAAYGAYSKQNDVNLIYQTNIVGLLNLLEVTVMLIT